MRLANLIALVSLFALPFGLCAASASDPAPKIAVLRIADVLTGSKAYQAGNERMRKEQAEAVKQKKEFEDKLQQLEAQLQVISPGHDRFQAIREEVEITRARAKLFMERMNQELDKRQLALIKESFASVRAALKGFCEEKGIKLVLLAPQNELKSPRLETIELELGMQSVLFYEQSMDITDAFIPFLNARYETGAAPPAPAPAPEAKPGSEKP